MNIVNISNLFNQICLGINVAVPNTIGFYHYGWYSDINANVSNNWTGNNDLGRLYPAVQLMYPTATIDIKEKSVKGSIDCRMVVSAPQYYENNAQYKDESIIETQAKLEALAINILSEYNRIARTMQTGVQNPITIDYLSDAHNENLVLLDIKFRIWYVWDCPTITADIAGLSAPFDTLPPIDTDLEKQQLNIGIPPTNIVNPKIAGAGLVNTKTDVIDNGTWAGDLPITFTYQWQRNSIDIVGETGTQYTTVLADLGLGIACLVTATNIAGSAIAQSNVIKIS